MQDFWNIDNRSSQKETIVFQQSNYQVIFVSFREGSETYFSVFLKKITIREKEMDFFLNILRKSCEKPRF